MPTATREFQVMVKPGGALCNLDCTYCYYLHTRPYWQQAAALIRVGRPLEALMEEVRAADAQARARAGRNDPCPCGSGRKFKRCCLR
jgi:DNA repair photolyase